MTGATSAAEFLPLGHHPPEKQQLDAAVSTAAASAKAADVAASSPWAVNAQLQSTKADLRLQEQHDGVVADANEKCGFLQKKQQKTPKEGLPLHVCRAPSDDERVLEQPPPRQQQQQFLLQERQHSREWNSAGVSSLELFVGSSNDSSSTQQQQDGSHGARRQLLLLLRCLASTPFLLVQQVLQHLLLLLNLLQIAASQAAQLEIWILAAATGIATAVAAVYIQLSSDFFADLRTGFCRGSLLKSQAACISAFPKGFVGVGPWTTWASVFGIEGGLSADIVDFVFFLFVSVGAATAAAAAVCTLAPQAAGSGIADTKVFMSGFRNSSFLYPRVLLVKLLTLSLAVGSGLSLGKEGPMVHIACCLGFLLLSGCRYATTAVPRVYVHLKLRAAAAWRSFQRCTSLLTVGNLRFRSSEGSTVDEGPRRRKPPSLSLRCRGQCSDGVLGPRSADESLNAILLAACAAGVGCAFSAPIGGLLFAFEEMAGGVGALAVRMGRGIAGAQTTLWICCCCCVAAAITMHALGNLDPMAAPTLFQSTRYTFTYDLWELIPFACLGILGGLLGPVFVRLCIKWLRVHKALFGNACSPVKEAALVAAISAVTNTALPMMRHTSAVLLENLFSRCSADASADPLNMCVRNSSTSTSSMSSNNQGPALSDAYRVDAGLALELCCVLLFKTLLTIFSFGLMVPAGIFIPALTIGASYGRLMGLLMLRLQPLFRPTSAAFATPGAYALVGAVSFLGGVTQTNIALIVILIEVTKTSAALALPFLLSLAIAKLLSARGQQGGFYAALIRFKRQPFFFDESQVCFDDLTAADGMERDMEVICVEESLTIATLKALAENCTFHGFPVVLSRSSRRLCGYIHAWQLRCLLQHLLLLQHPLVHAHTMVSFWAFRAAEEAKLQQQHRQQDLAFRSAVCLLLVRATDGALVHSVPLLQLAADGRLRAPAAAEMPQAAAADGSKFPSVPLGPVEMQRMDCCSRAFDSNPAATAEADAVEAAAVAKAVAAAAAAEGRAAAGIQVYVDLSLLVDEKVLQLPPHTPLLHVYRMFGLLQCEVCLLSRCGTLEGLIGRKSFLTTMGTPHLDECRY